MISPSPWCCVPLTTTPACRMGRATLLNSCRAGTGSMWWTSSSAASLGSWPSWPVRRTFPRPTCSSSASTPAAAASRSLTGAALGSTSSCRTTSTSRGLRDGDRGTAVGRTDVAASGGAARSDGAILNPQVDVGPHDERQRPNRVQVARAVPAQVRVLRDVLLDLHPEPRQRLLLLVGQWTAGLDEHVVGLGGVRRLQPCRLERVGLRNRVQRDAVDRDDRHAPDSNPVRRAAVNNRRSARRRPLNLRRRPPRGR
jgi:hypothetical protein